MPLFTFEHVSVSFGRHALLDDASFQIDAGECVYLIGCNGAVKPVVQLVGVSGTEITGPCLDPSGTRLYFSSQRNPGVTFKVTGPFAPVLPPAPVPLLGAFSQAVLIGTFASAVIHRLRGRNRPDA